jgi:hypothetical protein
MFPPLNLVQTPLASVRERSESEKSVHGEIFIPDDGERRWNLLECTTLGLS